MTLLFPFNLSVLLVFSSFSIIVSSFVFLVTADVKLICIYHLTFNIYWDVPQLEQLTFCCRQKQNYIVCVLCGSLVWLPFTNTDLFRFTLGSSMFCIYTLNHSFCILGWVPAPLYCKELMFLGAVERWQGYKLEQLR